MPLVGFSTGALALGDFDRALGMLVSTQADAVELSALRWSELPRLLDSLSSIDLSRYAYTSIHAPTDAPDERELVSLLNDVATDGLNIVVHPDRICDHGLWRPLGTRVCIENMDSRKRTGRTAHELRSIFAKLPEARLCFDVAHARHVDPTMTEAVRILTCFGDRLAQVHLSELNSEGKHFALSFVAKRAYEPLAQLLFTVPVIIESPVHESHIEDELQEAYELLQAGRSNGG